MTRRGRFLTRWLGRACGAVAAVMLALWLFWPSLGYLIAASPDGRWGVRGRAGQIDIVHSSEPSLVVIRNGDVTAIGVNPSSFRLQELRKQLLPEPFAVERAFWGAFRATPLLPAEGQRWYPVHIRSGATGVLCIPAWCFATVPLGVLFITESRHRRRVRAERTGRCPRCNYDRTGLAADAPCPECGKPLTPHS